MPLATGMVRSTETKPCPRVCRFLRRDDSVRLCPHAERRAHDRPIQAYDRLLTCIPAVYREAVLNEAAGVTVSIKNDRQCLASLKQYRSLMSLAEEARKPMFFLKPSDGALGGHAKAVQECYKDFRELAQTIADRCGVPNSVTQKKKLIEVALLLDEINKASAREKSIRHGHPSTLHFWWARRPLAAARAVIFAQMVDEPYAHPGLFKTEKAQEKERQRLVGIIENLVFL